MKEKLKKLYKEMAELTLPECKKCRVPLSCCSPEYCRMAMDHAKEVWGVKLTPTGHPKLPLMGAEGCVAEPHLRPNCTMHTCDINSLGCKKGDLDWTERYFALREEIENLEFEIFANHEKA